MTYGLYVIYDTVAEEASPPFSARNVAVAKRQFQQAMHSLPEYIVGDYQLLRVGTYMDSPVRLVGEYPPVNVEFEVADVVDPEVSDAIESLKKEKEMEVENA